MNGAKNIIFKEINKLCDLLLILLNLAQFPFLISNLISNLVMRFHKFYGDCNIFIQIQKLGTGVVEWN
ncbi:MAG TPA: hypothetical protein DCM38_02790 [Gammaproteobacteria bacterium]|nr:hypothetical protein [Gammaproteobacteria bacterium]